ncbi:MAG: hypothetical protein E7592_04550 [Ruminococcaceae bacterium]|nr:hypothetical protein [Oscillospiraceae bacterium]
MNGFRSGSIPSSKRKGIGGLADEDSGRLSFLSCAVLSVTVLLYSLVFPVVLHGSQEQLEIWSIAILLACFAFLIFLVRKAKWTIFAIFTVFLSLGFSQSLFLPAILISTPVAIGAYAALVQSCKKSQLFFPIALPLLIYVSVALLIHDPISALYSLVFILPAAALGLSCRADLTLNTAILSCTSAIILPLIALCAASVYAMYGEISFEALTRYASSSRDLLGLYMSQYLSALSNIELTPALYREISDLVNSYVNLAPGFIVALCLTLSFFANSLKNDLFLTQGVYSDESNKGRTLSVSTVAALLFLIAHIMSFTTDASNNTTFIAVVFGNVSFMLVPALALAGITAIKNFSKKLGILSLIIFALLIFVLFNATSSFFILIALIGAFYVLVTSIDSWAKDFYGKGDNQ